MNNYLLISIICNLTLLFSIPMIILITWKKAKRKYLLLGIRQAYQDMSLQCNKIQYRKVKFLFNEMINNIKNGK